MNKAKNKQGITIIGGGMIGLFLAAELSKRDIPIHIVETNPPPLSADENVLNSRVSAINVASQQWLSEMGVWDKVRSNCYSPLLALKVWDALSEAEIDFDSAEIAKPALGAIVENREIIRVLWDFLKGRPNINLYCPVIPDHFLQESDSIALFLSDHTILKSDLLIGADGGESWLKKQMGIEWIEKSYHHDAIIAVIQTEKSHQRIAWQVFLPNGVLALLPLRHLHHCAMVWSTAPADAKHLLSLDESSFNEAINNAFGLRLGNLTRLTALKTFPLTMRHAKQYVKPRLALVGDAAHTIHPLAGQGVNLGFADAFYLAKSIISAYDAKKDISAWRLLRSYERARKADNALMLLAVHTFKELFATQSTLIVQARSAGFKMTDRLPLLKKQVMQYAIGNY